MTRVITFIGPFTDEDLALLMQSLRQCEQNQPTQNFLMTIEDDSKRPVKDMRDFLKERFPAVKGTPVSIATFNRD